jgi:hypothetical protein
MSVETEGASGPQSDIAAKVDPLDAALGKAMEQINDGSDDFPPMHLKEARSRQDKVAGDARTNEDAPKPDVNGGEAPDKPAAPKGNAELIEAPNHWDAERKAAFATLNGYPDAQKAMLAMAKGIESGFTRKSQELSDQARFAESVRGLFNDAHRQQLQAAGLDEVGGLRYLLQLKEDAMRNPAEYARWFIQNNGLTPEQLGFPSRQPQPQQHAPQPAASTGNAELDKLLEDPGVAQLRSQFGQFAQAAQSEIGALKQYIANQQYAQQQHARQQYNTAVQSLQKQWQDFRSAQDDHGQLKFAHADTLQKQMGAIMETDPQIASMPDGPAKLDAAYQAALWARPDLRTGLLEQERTRAAADAQKKAEAERAKAAAKVRPATGAPTMPVKKGGLDAALDSAWTAVGMKD